MARMPSASVQQKSKTLYGIDIALPPLPSGSSSQVGMEEFYKISGLQAASRELTLSASKARGIISKLNLHDLSRPGRWVKQPEKVEERGRDDGLWTGGFCLVSGKMHNSNH